MRTFLITSALTFVPNNYTDFVKEMSAHPDVAGLIIVENRSARYVLQAIILILSGAAPRLGLTLIKNYFGRHTEQKRQAFAEKQKKFFIVKDINSAETRELLKNENIDLILNARTRDFFKKPLLQLPKFGCINIHHGLLPDQRGLMCDFWAHMEKTAFGFSVHEMTPKLDDGRILRRQEVVTDRENYLDSILQGSKVEAKVCADLLNQIKDEGKVSGEANIKTEKTLYRKNPGLFDFYKLRFSGVKI